MGKRRIERDIEDLEEEILEDLDPLDRIQLIIRATVENEEEWKEMLRNSVPRQTWTGPDPAVKHWLWVALLLAKQAVYDLHTRAIKLDSVRSHQDVLIYLWATDDGHVRGYIPENDEFIDHICRNLPAELVRSLFVIRQGYEKFAQSVFGVSLEEWLSLDPDGPEVLAQVDEQLEEYESLMTLPDIEDVDEPSVSGDALMAEIESEAETMANELIDQWDSNAKLDPVTS